VRLQSAIEFLATYGWAFIMLTIALTVFFTLGVFNANNYAAQQCVFTSGFSCISFFFGADGSLRVNLQQANNAPINITSFGCSRDGIVSNTIMQKPFNPPTNQVFVSEGRNYTLVVQCYTNNGLFSGNSGDIFSGFLLINYTNKFTQLPGTAFGKIAVKVSALSVTTV